VEPVNSKQTAVQQSSQTPIKLLGSAATLALITLTPQAGQAQVILPPASSTFYFQTNSPRVCANDGDWYTTLGTGTEPNCGPAFGGEATTSEAPIHRFYFNITQEEIDAAGGTVSIDVLDAESINSVPPGSNPFTPAILDETSGSSDPVRFVLYQLVDPNSILTGDPTGQPEVGRQVIQGGADGQIINFSVTQPGTYLLTSESGALVVPATGVGITDDPDLNDDTNSFRLRIPSIGDFNAGLFRGTFQQNSGSAQNLSAFFLVGPPKPGEASSLFLRNFDLDAPGLFSGPVEYIYENPDGSTDVITGTPSGRTVWNNGGDLNTGGDTVPINNALGVPRAGFWTLSLNGVGSDNQGIVEVRIGDLGVPLNITEVEPQRAGNFTITPDETLSTAVGVPVDHSFVITNNFFTNDFYRLTLTGTDPNYTVQVIDPSTGNPLPLVDGRFETPILSPNESRTFVLRVTPNTGNVLQDVTTITATSFMDEQVRRQAGNPDPNPAPQSVVKTTTIGDLGFRITPSGTETTNTGVPAQHNFEVAVTGTPNTIDLLISEPNDPNFTKQIINRATGQPLTDTDGDGVIDTGVLNPGDPPLQLTLLVTPQPGAPSTNTTVITARDNNNEQATITRITEVANFTITPDTQIETVIGQPVDHEFTVTNIGSLPDVINLIPDGTNPDYTVEIIDPATGQPLPDTDGDGNPDTGTLFQGDSVDLILRVTPGPNATNDDVTLIRAIASSNGAVQTVTKTTTLPDDGTGDITLTKRITRVYRASTGQVQTFDALNPTTLPDGFVGVTIPNPQELAPGDLVEYTIYYNNETTGRVTNLEICDPIPTESEFVGDPTFVPSFQDLYSSGQSIVYNDPNALPLGNGVSISNVFDGDQGEYVNPLTPRASCPGESSGNQGAVVVRVGTVAPGEAGFIKFITQLQ
jgi:uncharacterized repeat protein (TIGR01451 family)